jgi:excisionase family DNA binding protein
VKRLLSVQEAADYTGFTVRYLRRLIFERRLIFYKDRQRVWLARADLDAYVDSLRIEVGEQGHISVPGRLRPPPPRSLRSR